MRKPLPREILFRGKRTDNGKWVEGSLDYHPVTKLAFIRVARHIYTNVDMVQPETVGQYTGLIDKNGKKIFEGDILEYRSVSVNGLEAVKHAVVFWDEHRWSYRVVYDNRWEYNLRGVEKCDIYRHVVSKFGEVIGNIHDNPDLSGGADNG